MATPFSPLGCGSVHATNYRYELRRGDTIVATGHMTNETPFEIGDTISVGSANGVVRDVGPRSTRGELRLVVELLDDRAAL